MVLGDPGTAASLERIRLAPLSETGVLQLARRYGVEAGDLYRKTSGNPFFVTEVLAAGQDTVPPTVQDAVLARVARLSSATRKLVEAASIIPSAAEFWLLERMCPDAIAGVEEGLASGILAGAPAGLAFRHEIARLAVEASIPPDRRLTLHRDAIKALAAPVAGDCDPTRLAHHGQIAGDADVVLRFAPEAAVRAARVGAHREAAAQYGRALLFAKDAPPERRAELLSRQADAFFLVGDYDAAIEARRRARDCYRQLGDRIQEGEALRAQSANLRCHGLVNEAIVAASDALALLEPLPPGRELARAYALKAMLALNREELEETERWCPKAGELAERIDDLPTRVHILKSLGTARWLGGDPDGRLLLEESLRLCEHADLIEDAGRAYINMSWAAVRLRDYAAAVANEAEALEYCLERGLDAWRFEVMSHKARRLLDQGGLEEAAQVAATVIASPHTNTAGRTIPMAVLARVRARRGDPDPSGPLEQGRRIAQPTGELQHLLPVAAAAAEVAWLDGGTSASARARQATEETLRLALDRDAARAIGELAAWRLAPGSMSRRLREPPTHTRWSWRAMHAPRPASGSSSDAPMRRPSCAAAGLMRKTT